MFKFSSNFKKNIAQVLCLTVAFTPVVAYAANSGRAANLQSTGVVRYTDGTNEIVIDSNDLVTLANEIDELETDAKWGQIQALQSLSDVAQKNSLTGVTLDTIRDVTFDQINSAIINSQSIDTTQSVYKLPNGSVTTDSTEEGAEEVQISGATAENLSAGTAAWVDGQYIVGNGADNNSYYALGSNKSIVTESYNLTSSEEVLLPQINVAKNNMKMVGYGITTVSLNASNVAHQQGYGMYPTIRISLNGDILTGACYMQSAYSGKIAFGTITVTVYYQSN